MKRIAAIIAAILVTFAVVGLTAPANAVWTNPPSGAYKIIEYNIGSGSECSPPEDCLDLLESQVTSYNPDAIQGTEFCYTDYLNFADFLHSRSQSANWDVIFEPMNPHSIPSGNAAGCQDDVTGLNEAKGNVLAGDFGSVYSYKLLKDYVNDPNFPAQTDPNNYGAGSVRYWPLTCAIPAVTTGHPTRVCVTHLPAGGTTTATYGGTSDAETDRKHALRVIQNLKDGVARNDDGTLVGGAWSRPAIGGDFNSNTTQAWWNNFLQDDLYCWSAVADPNHCAGTAQGTGAYAMDDPDTSSAHVDHSLFRHVAGISYSMTSVSTPLGLSTHDLRKVWVKY